MCAIQYSLLLFSDAMCAVQFIIVFRCYVCSTVYYCYQMLCVRYSLLLFSDAMCAVQFIIPSIIVVDSEKTAEDQIRFKGTMSVISIDQPYIHGNA